VTSHGGGGQYHQMSHVGGSGGLKLAKKVSRMILIGTKYDMAMVPKSFS